jgi:hypothetical protein
VEFFFKGEQLLCLVMRRRRARQNGGRPNERRAFFRSRCECESLSCDFRSRIRSSKALLAASKNFHSPAAAMDSFIASTALGGQEEMGGWEERDWRGVRGGGGGGGF